MSPRGRGSGVSSCSAGWWMSVVGCWGGVGGVIETVAGARCGRAESPPSKNDWRRVIVTALCCCWETKGVLGTCPLCDICHVDFPGRGRNDAIGPPPPPIADGWGPGVLRVASVRWPAGQQPQPQPQGSVMVILPAWFKQSNGLIPACLQFECLRTRRTRS